MRMIYEENIENFDFIEIILSKEDVHNLIFGIDKGIIKEFAGGVLGIRNLNLFIRIETKNEELDMPLVKGAAAKTRKGFSENIRREMHEGKSQKQSVAIAYSEAGEAKKKNKKGKKK